MPHSETYHVEQLIARHVLSDAEHTLDNDHNFQTITGRLRNERIKLESLLEQLLCSSFEEAIIKRKFQYTYDRLLILSDKLYAALKVLDVQSRKYTLGVMAMDHINALMRYAERFAERYIDEQYPLSDHMHQQLAEPLLEDFERLQEQLLAAEVDGRFIQAFATFFAVFAAPREKMFAAQFRYAQKLLRGLHRAMDDKPVDDWLPGIWRLMCYLNFNKIEMIDYATALVKDLAEMDARYLVVQDRLYSFLRDVKQMEEHLELAYQRDRISLKAYMVELLQEEISLLQQHRSNIQTEIANADDNYFVIDLSVKRLNLWAKINVELGTIPYHTTSHVVRVMSNYVRTLKPGAISANSAVRKLEDFDPTTVKGLHLWLTRQLEHLEKKYAEQLEHQ
jgi:hypothetical protein